MTDRFSHADRSTSTPCNTTDGLYCGGTWRGIINNLDYISGMGFDAIMISPIIHNLEGRVSYGEAYHGYWADDIYNLNAHFGSRQDLLDLKAALQSRDMFLMVDSVLNNMAWMTNGSNPGTSIDYSGLTPFNQQSYYHPYCAIQNYENYTDAQLCWTGDNIVALPDLKQEDPYVASTLEAWAQQSISNFSIDGLRIDAAKHIYPDFLPQFYNTTGSIFMTGEVLEQDPEIVCNYQKNYLPSLPNYPMYYAMLNTFTKGNTSGLAVNIKIMSELCPDPPALTMFSENHDLQRFPSMTPDLSLAMNVIAFTILFDGVPMIYQGQEQHLNGAFPPNNREALWLTNYNTNAPLYQLMAKLNKIRRQAGRVDPNYFNVFSYPIFTGKSEVAIRKGNEGRQTILVLSTNGETGGQYSLVLPVTYQPGTVVTEIMTCVNYTINESGQLNLLMDKGQPRVLFPANQMGDSGLCGVGDWSPAGTPSQNNSLYDHWSAGSSTSLYSNRPSLWLLTAISSLIYSATILVL